MVASWLTTSEPFSAFVLTTLPRRGPKLPKSLSQKDASSPVLHENAALLRMLQQKTRAPG